MKTMNAQEEIINCGQNCDPLDQDDEHDDFTLGVETQPRGRGGLPFESQLAVGHGLWET
jgi:hypothetical protein